MGTREKLIFVWSLDFQLLEIEALVEWIRCELSLPYYTQCLSYNGDFLKYLKSKKDKSVI